MRTPKTFTIDEEIDDYVASTRGNRSASDRVNELLHRAILLEQQDRLQQEAAEFFSAPDRADRTESRAFQKASARTFVKD